LLGQRERAERRMKRIAIYPSPLIRGTSFILPSGCFLAVGPILCKLQEASPRN
jgi:hypothetical protein